MSVSSRTIQATPGMGQLAAVFAALLAGTLGGLLATWVTFAPCFAWIFLGAPFIEALRGNAALGEIEAAKEHAVRLADLVGGDRALRQFQRQCAFDELGRHL